MTTKKTTAKTAKKIAFKIGDFVKIVKPDKSGKEYKGKFGYIRNISPLKVSNYPFDVQIDGDDIGNTIGFKAKELEKSKLPKTAKVAEAKVKTIWTTYEITKVVYKMRVEIENHRLTLYSLNGEKSFKFIGSKPATVKALGELLVKASEL